MAYHGYARTSPPGERGDDVEAQVQKLQEMAQMRGARILRPFVDREVPGHVPLAERAAGGKLLKMLRPGDVLLCTTAERLFRSAGEALATVTDWRERGVALVFTTVGPEAVNLHGAGAVFLSMLAVLAEFERERVLYRAPAVSSPRSLTGGRVGATAPFGFRLLGAGEEARLEPDPEQQAAIRDMVKWRSAMSLRKVAEKVRETHGVHISHEGVRQVLADYELRLTAQPGNGG